MRQHYPLNPATGLEDQAQLPWSDGVPNTGQEGSYPPSAMCVETMMELVNLIAMVGLIGTSSDLNQVTRAIRSGQLDFGAADLGSADAMLCRIGLAHTQIKAGLPFTIIKSGLANTGNAVPTLTLTDPQGNNGITGTVVKNNGSALAKGDLPGGAMLTLRAIAPGVYGLVSLFTLSDLLALIAANGAFITGADTGTAGAIKIATPTPAVTAPTRWMTVVTTPAAVNPGAGTLTIGGVTGPIIYPSGSPLLGGEMAARPQVFIYDVAGNWQWQGAQAPVLQQATSFYVNGSTGSDTNSGTTAATAFKTIQRAANVVQGINQNGKQVTINVADGTYGPLQVVGAFSGPVTFQGDTANPSACVIAGGSVPAVIAQYGATFTISGFRVTGYAGILSQGFGAAVTYLNMDFGPVTTAHVYVDNGYASCFGSYGISGGGQYHLYNTHGTLIASPSQNNTVTITNSPSFSSTFLECLDGSFTRITSSTTFTGATSGSFTKFDVRSNSVIDSYGGTSSFIPGSSYTSSTGGVIV